MATYKTKVKDLKNISNKTDIGGAPFWGDDILGLQINAKADFINTNESLRRRLPLYEYDRGASPAEKMHGSALILSGLTYNNAVSTAVVVSSGYFLAEGEVCYYPGGTFNTSAGSATQWLYLGKGAALTESRVFADGVNKEFKVEYGATAYLTNVGTTGPATEPLTSADLTKDFLFLTIVDTTASGYTEKYFTTDGAHKLTEIGDALTFPAFTDFASLGTGWATDAPLFGKLASRVLPNGQTQIAGAVKKTMSGGSSPEVIGTMAKENISFSGSVNVPIPCIVYDQTNYLTNYQLTVSSSGVLTLKPGPSATFPTALIVVFIDHTMTGATSVFNQSYTYNKTFMDVTP